MEPSVSLILYAFVTCFAFASADETPVGSLYAYGQNISGLPLIYADGAALLGYGQPEGIATATNLTFKIDDTATTLSTTPNDTSLASNWTTPLLYIDTQTGTFNAAGFVSTSNTSYTTAGFTFFGRILLWQPEDDEGSVGRSFWAAPRDDGLWSLLWNSDNAASQSAVPVVLKRQPPPARNDD